MTYIGTFEFIAPLWRYPGEDGWHFISLPRDISADIADLTAGIRGGFGFVRVEVKVGTSSWQTSLFPDGKTGVYLLPMKRTVRVTQHLETGDDVHARVEIVDRGRWHGEP